MLCCSKDTMQVCRATCRCDVASPDGQAAAAEEGGVGTQAGWSLPPGIAGRGLLRAVCCLLQNRRLSPPSSQWSQSLGQAACKQSTRLIII